MKVSTLFTFSLVPFAQIVAASATPSFGEGIEVLGAGHYHEQNLRKRDILEKRQRPNPVTGARKGYSGDARVYRQEIRNFVRDQDQRVVDLFLLALESMYNLSKGNPQSYYDIAGVHGVPFVGWNGETSPTGANRQSGYCTHGSNLFPTWHRPYLAFIEQEIWRNAERIVNGITNAARKAEFQRALNSIRLPYWDWAVDASIPSVLSSPSWTFKRLPDGRTNVSKRNPLYSFNFPRGPYYRDDFYTSPYNQLPETRRSPTANQDMRSQQSNLRQSVYQTLTSVRSWSAFANQNLNSGEGFSIESIHNGPHSWIGGRNGGHMYSVFHSSFDPIFWLHHANIDRLFAIWQAINPTVGFQEYYNQGGTYGIPPGPERADTGLQPWRGLNGRWWTSSSVLDTSTFGYGYPETPKWNYKNRPTEYRRFVISRVNALYGASVQRSVAKRDVLDSTNATLVGIENSINSKGQYYEWKVDIAADKSALNGTYQVYFFIGKPDRNPETWRTASNLVGSYVVWTMDNIVAPWLNASQVDPMVSGGVALNDALIKELGQEGLDSLNIQDAEPFLRKNLRWRITKDGKKVNRRKVKNLGIKVLRSLVKLPPDEFSLPEWGPWETVVNLVREIQKQDERENPDQKATSILPVGV